MHTIVLATRKGGSGKSTLAAGLAFAAKQAGHNVRLLETDPQGTLTNWQVRRGLVEPIVETVYEAIQLEHRLQALARGGVTLAVIDTASGVSAATTAAIRHADLCMIPVRPSLPDIEATASTVSLARAWRKPFAFILNQTPPRGTRLNTAATTLSTEAALELAEVVALPCIAMRNDHQDALAAGLAVGEYAPAGKSAAEVRELWLWIEAKLHDCAPLGEDVAAEHAKTPHAAMFADTLRAPQRTITLATLRDSGPSWDACL
jgi:chromosome partitioning protein